MSKTQFIVYVSNQEIIVTTPQLEKQTIELFFTDGGRDIDNFDREEVQDEGIAIESSLSRE
jgi:hypothetical protein